MQLGTTRALSQRPGDEENDGASTATLAPPATLKARLPLTPALTEQVRAQQVEVKRILAGDDKRLLIITGPCSLHCPDAALEYGRRLLALQQEVADQCLLVMRAYLEKPRTTIGWKGMFYAPDPTGSADLLAGAEVSRRLLIQLAALGLPLATEALNPIAFQYIDDLVSWVAIGARTTESQIHREMASGLRCATGFKNGTHGRFDTAVQAIQAARQGHEFIAVADDGGLETRTTQGNMAAHLVLRGGAGRPNYDVESVSAAAACMAHAEVAPALVVDCSHENSGKDHTRQAQVLRAVLHQRRQGPRAVKGVMLESHLSAGRQPISSAMEYGVSITDACIGWDETEQLVREAHCAEAAASKKLTAAG